jgi:hypothetical protein
MNNTTNNICRVLLGVVALTCSPFTKPAPAAQFSFLDPAYTQQIYAGPNVGLPGAWTSTNQLLARKSNVPTILEYSATANNVYQGTSVHDPSGTGTIHNISLLAPGNNLTLATNGFLYLPTTVGLQRVDPNNWATPAATVTSAGGPGYGVNSLPNGNIVYAANGSSTDIHIYNPGTNVDSLVYTSAGLIDDIETSLTGLIALAGQGNNEIILLNSSGSFVQQFSTTQYPDGLAFATTASPPALYSNDNKGTITRYDFGLGYTAAPTNVQVIASGGSYGDIAPPGPDCAFYVTQFFNNGFHGSAPFGTNWDNGTTNNDPSIIRIGSKTGCLFDPPVGPTVPEPTAAMLLLLGSVTIGLQRPRRS